MPAASRGALAEPTLPPLAGVGVFPPGRSSWMDLGLGSVLGSGLGLTLTGSSLGLGCYCSAFSACVWSASIWPSSCSSSLTSFFPSPWLGLGLRVGLGSGLRLGLGWGRGWGQGGESGLGLGQG